MFTNIIIQWGIALVVITSFVACDTKKVERVQHEEAIDRVEVSKEDNIESIQDQASESLKNIISSVKSTDLQTQGLVTLSDKNEAQLLAMSLLKDVVTPLEKYILNEDYLRDPQWIGDERRGLYKVLIDFNQALLLAYYNDPSSVIQSGIIDRYVHTIFSQCDEMMDSCVNAMFFKADQRSAYIIKIKSMQIDYLIQNSKKKNSGQCTNECVTQVREYYRLLRMAFALKNQRLDSDLEFSYIKYARDFSQYVQTLDVNSQKVMEKIHGHIFDTIVTQFNPDNLKDKSHLAEFVRNFNPWNYSRTEKDPFSKSTPKIFAMAARSFQNKEDIAQAIREQQSKGDSSGISFSQKVQELYKTAPHLFSYLSVDINKYELSKLQNVYFLMIDRIYRRHLNAQEVVTLWEGSEKDTQKLFQTIEDYIKIEVLRQVDRTNRFLVETIGKGEMNNQSLLNQVLNSSQEQSREWNRLFASIDQVRSLIDNIFNQNSPLVGYVKIKQSLERLNSNVKYFSVYPSMMLITYFMSKMDSSMTLKTWFGREFSIDPNQVIAIYFDGSWAPWFSFGNDFNPLNKYELLLAYNYALRMGAFEAYESAKISNEAYSVTKVNFFKTVIGGYLNELRLSIDSDAQSFYGRVMTHSRRGEFAKMCQNPEKYISYIPFTDVGDYTFLGTKIKGPASYPNDFYNLRFESSIRIYRIEFERKLNYVKVMIDGLEEHIKTSADYLKSVGKLEKEQSELKEIKAHFDKLIKQRDQFVNQGIRIYKEIRGCLRELQKIEYDRQLDLIQKEKDFLSQVHDNMKALQEKSEMPHKLGGKLDNITAEQYYYSQYDLYMRMARRLQEYKTYRVVVQIPEDRHLDQLEMVRNAVSKPIQWNPDKAAFVSQALRYLNGRGQSYLNWFSPTDSRSVDMLVGQIETAIEIYKYGKMKMVNPEMSDEEGLVAEVLAVIPRLSISEDERRVLFELGLTSKYDVEKLKDIFLNKNDYSLMPLFEMMFERLRKDVPQYRIEHNDLYNEAEELANNIRDADKFLFALDNNYCKVMRENYRSFVTQKESRMQLFSNYIKNINMQEILGVDTLTFQLSDEGQMIKLPISKRPVSFLTENNWERVRLGFHRITKDYFAPHKNDKECAQSGSPLCNIEIVDYCKIN